MSRKRAGPEIPVNQGAQTKHECSDAIACCDKPVEQRRSLSPETAESLERFLVLLAELIGRRHLSGEGSHMQTEKKTADGALPDRSTDG